MTTQDAAQKIIDQLKKGAKFEDLAKKESIDSSKEQGGDLGWFSPSNMVKPFADAVAALKKGEYTQTPVQTQYGWHVIQLIDTRETPRAAARFGQGSRRSAGAEQEVQGLSGRAA